MYQNVEKILFNDCQDVGLTQDGVLLAVYLDLCAGIFAQQNFLANFNNHLFLVAVNNAARTNSDDLCYLWLFLCSSWWFLQPLPFLQQLCQVMV